MGLKSVLDKITDLLGLYLYLSISLFIFKLYAEELTFHMRSREHQTRPID